MSDAPDPSELARRYLDLWQQHLTQAANDPELAAGLAKLAQLVPGMPGMAWPPVYGSSDDAAPPGTPAAAGPSDDGGGDFGELRRRLADAEKRLDALERGSRKTGKRSAKGAGKRKS